MSLVLQWNLECVASSCGAMDWHVLQCILSEQFRVVMSFCFEIPHGVLSNITYDNTGFRDLYCGRNFHKRVAKFCFLRTELWKTKNKTLHNRVASILCWCWPLCAHHHGQYHWIRLNNFEIVVLFCRSRLTQLTLQSNAAIKELKRTNDKVTIWKQAF